MHIPDDTLTPEERALIEHFRRNYAPPPRTSAQRLAMHNALHARLQRRWLPSWPLAAAACAAAALALWFVLPQRWANPPATASGAGAVLVAYALDVDPTGELDDMLPQDYAAVEDIFDL